MPLIFDESYFKDAGYSNYQNFPHFRQRAEWIRDNLSGRILEVGCAHGYLMSELRELSIIIDGIDRSDYAETKLDSAIKNNVVVSDIVDVVITGRYDWIISWNVLDCLDDDTEAQKVVDVLNGGSENQLHVICMSGEDFTKQGYFIRDYDYWRGILPSAVLVDYETKRVYDPTGRNFSKIPLCWGLVSD